MIFSIISYLCCTYKIQENVINLTSLCYLSFSSIQCLKYLKTLKFYTAAKPVGLLLMRRGFQKI